jgi:hypothetical protein
MEELRREVLSLAEAKRAALIEHLWRSLFIFGLEVSYNQGEPVRCFSRLPSGVNIHLYTTDTELLCLNIIVKTHGGRIRHVLDRIQPGDELRFRFLRVDAVAVDDAEPSTMEKLPAQSRVDESFMLQPGSRVGLDVTFSSGETVRISHPEGGGFSFMMGNVPLVYARAFVMAGNENESCHRQFPNIFPDEAISLRVVEIGQEDTACELTRKS